MPSAAPCARASRRAAGRSTPCHSGRGVMKLASCPVLTRVFHHRQFDADALAARQGRTPDLRVPAGPGRGGHRRRHRRAACAPTSWTGRPGRRGPGGGRRFAPTPPPRWPPPPAPASWRWPTCSPSAARATARARRSGRACSPPSGDLIAWCDADIVDFDTRFVLGLVGPLLTDPSVEFVKGFYDRPVEGTPGTRRAHHRAGGPAAAGAAVPRTWPPSSSRWRASTPAAARCSRRCRSCRATASTSACWSTSPKRFGMESIAQVDLGTRRAPQPHPRPALAPGAGHHADGVREGRPPRARRPAGHAAATGPRAADAQPRRATRRWWHCPAYLRRSA